MTHIVHAPDTLVVPARRRFMGALGTATLSATAVAILAGCERMATAQGSGMGNSTMASDVQTLNVALGLEHEAIAAYQLGAESGLLQKPVLDVAVQFSPIIRNMQRPSTPPSARWAACRCRRSRRPNTRAA